MTMTAPATIQTRDSNLVLHCARCRVTYPDTCHVCSYRESGDSITSSPEMKVKHVATHGNWYLCSSQAAAARSPVHGPVIRHQTNESVNKDLCLDPNKNATTAFTQALKLE